jgi:hypothetical protein
MNQMEFRFDTTGSIHMKTSKYCLIAVNEPKGLIGIYDVNNSMVSILTLIMLNNKKIIFNLLINYLIVA